MFKNLKRKPKKISIKKKIKVNFLSNHLTFVFDQELSITFDFQINFLHKLYFHLHYKKAYDHKKFQNLNIKILFTIACPNFKKPLCAFRVN